MMPIIWHLMSWSAIFVCIFGFFEFIFRKYKLPAEQTRKFVHVLCAVIVAFLPHFLSYKEIAILSGLFALVILVSKNFHIFGSIHNVSRKTNGELWYPLGILSVALIQPSAAIFAVAVLTMGIADTIANLVGRKWGKHKYKVFGQNKTLEGSLACMVVTMCIFTVFVLSGAFNLTTGSYALRALGLSALVTIVEAMSPNGSDNLSIPLAVVLALYSL